VKWFVIDQTNIKFASKVYFFGEPALLIHAADASPIPHTTFIHLKWDLFFDSFLIEADRVKEVREVGWYEYEDKVDDQNDKNR